MKFNDEELKQFKRDLGASLQELSKKYKIDITIGKINVIDDMFTVRLSAEHKILPKKVITPSKPIIKQAPTPKEKKLDAISDKELEDLNLDDLDLDDLDDKEPKKVEPKPVKKVEPQKTQPTPVSKPKKLDAISDKELEDLDLDDLDLDDLEDKGPKKVEEKPIKKVEPQKVQPKPEQPSISNQPKKKKISELTDEEIATMDLNDIDFEDEEEEKPTPKKRKSYREDDDSRYDQELERFINPGKKVSYDDPKTVFDEKNDGKKYTYDEDISDDEIDAYLSSSGILNYSFQAKLIQADGLLQDYYTDVKNLLLSNDGVKSKVGWDYDTFTYGSKIIARLGIKDDKLEVYLALDPEEYEGSSYNVTTVKKPDIKETKILAVVGSMDDEDQLYDLIGDLAEAFGILPGEDRYDDYHFQYETNDELIARGLIKQN